MSLLKLQLNQRYRISLKHLNPETVPGKFGKQLKWTLSDSRLVYTALIVKPQIEALKIEAGQQFEISKEQTESGVQWRVYPVESKPQPAAEILNSAEALDAAVPEDPPRKEPPRKPPTRLEYALKTAVHAASIAEQHGREIGYAVRFQSQDIRAMAISLMIQQEKKSA